jgi:hypothetical protein
MYRKWTTIYRVLKFIKELFLTYGAEPFAGTVSAYTGTLGHPGRPANLAAEIFRNVDSVKAAQAKDSKKPM